MNPSSIQDRAIGAMMIAASAGIPLMMMHHPSGTQGAGLAGFIHGGMIALLLLWTWGFAHFAFGLGVRRPLVLAGLITYGVSLFAHIGAGTINGFVVPALVLHEVRDHDLFLFAWETNQALAKLGVYLTGAAYALWSVELLGRREGSSKAVGAAGLVAGLGPALLLATGVLEMRVGGAFIVYAAHAAWAALVGFMILRGRFATA